MTETGYTFVTDLARFGGLAGALRAARRASEPDHDEGVLAQLVATFANFGIGFSLGALSSLAILGLDGTARAVALTAAVIGFGAFVASSDRDIRVAARRLATRDTRHGPSVVNLTAAGVAVTGAGRSSTIEWPAVEAIAVVSDAIVLTTPDGVLVLPDCARPAGSGKDQIIDDLVRWRDAA